MQIVEKVLDSILDLIKDLGNKLLDLLHSVMIELATAQTAVRVAHEAVKTAETAYNAAASVVRPPSSWLEGCCSAVY